MATNGQLVFTDVDKVTFKGVGNTSNAVIDTTTGKIGVGVDSPDANLHVVGNCFVSTNFELGGTMTMGTVTVRAQHELSAITATGNTTPHTVEFQNATTGFVTTANIEVGTANLFVDTSTSNVGIGTNAPIDTLHINGGTRFAGHIIPTTNATFDIGSAENKVRDLYVDTNSIWVGDRAKIAFENGKMKFKRRKLNKVPRMLVNLAISGGRTDEADVETHAIAFAQTKDPTISTVSDLKLEHLRDYAKTFDNTKAVSDIFADNEEDYEAITASEAFMEVGSNIFTEHSLSIGKTTDPTATLDIYKEDTTAAGQTKISSITGVFSGSDATGGNINNTGLYINLDSSATGGTANNTEEHRVWGIDADITVTGDSDDIRGGRFFATSELDANGTDQNTNIYGIDAQGRHKGSAPNTNIIGVNARSLKSPESTGLTDTMIGVTAESEINAGTCTDAYGVRSQLDRNGGAVTNSYLFYGRHLGSATAITNNYGLYVTDVDKHYLEGNVGIGTTSPGAPLHVNGDIAVGVSGSLRRTADNDLINIYSGSDNTSPYMFMTGKNRSSNANKIGFRIASAAKLEIYNDKIFIADRVGIGYSAPDSKLDLRNSVIYNGETSTNFNPGTMGLLQFWAANTTATRWNITVHENNDLYFLCRTSGSGAGSWHQIGYLKDNTNVAQITFTGQHRSFIDGVSYVNYDSLEGLIVSANKNKYYDVDENITTGVNAIRISQSLPLVSLSCRERDKACFGVISGSEDPDSREYVQGSYVSVIRKQKGDTRAFINSVGEGAIWVTNINGNLESGDYITTSNITGYGQKQDSDSLKNYTVAKITMDCDFDPVTQPTQIIRKETSNVNYWVKTTYENVSEEDYSNLEDENRQIIDGVYQKITKEESKTEQEGYELEVRQELVNVLDEHGQLQWEDHPTETEKAYKIRYLDADGNITDEANHVHKAAFVGCTYHCG